MFKVLIVDDVDILRRDLRRLKVWGEASGFTITDEAANGKEALQKLNASAFDMVITDIRMPVMDGMALLRAISKDKLCPCVVLLSDYTEFSYAREGLVHGAFDYLGKPIDGQKLEELLQRVKQFLLERENEKAKLKQLEGMVEVAFYPANDVEKAAALIIETSDSALDYANRLLDTIGAALDYDRGKALIVIKNAFEEVTQKVLEQYPWIKSFTDFSLLKHLDFADCCNWECLKERVSLTVNAMVAFLRKFVVWKGSQLIKDACLAALIHVEEDVSVKSISEKLYISKAYLSELFKQTTGLSLLEYITRIKMERSKVLLKEGVLKNYEIAERLGFNDHEYFSKIFKKYTGKSPNDYRKQSI